MMRREPMSPELITSYTQQVLQDGFCVLKQFIPRATLEAWNEAFLPLLDTYLAEGGSELNRGAARYYVTLPFVEPFADPAIFEHDDLLAICEGLVGKNFVMCQLASDTPLLGSDYQPTHRDAPPLFPEAGFETPPFQLAINFPLVDVTLENGPIEIARGTHMLSKAEGMAKLERGEVQLEAIPMDLGDLMIRDVRGLHRGTPNRTVQPRPMVVIGFSRSWMLRPEVCIEVPRATHEKLSRRAQQLLRFNPITESVSFDARRETYDNFAY